MSNSDKLSPQARELIKKRQQCIQKVREAQLIIAQERAEIAQVDNDLLELGFNQDRAACW